MRRLLEGSNHMAAIVRSLCCGLAAFLLFLPKTVLAEDQPTADELLRRYDAVLIEKLRGFDGDPTDLLGGTKSDLVREAAHEVFGGHWDVLKRYGDEKLARMTLRSPDRFVGEPAHAMDFDAEMAAAMRLMGFGMRAATKLWDPEAFVTTFSSMALARFMEAKELALNTVVGSLTSRNMFRTDWKGRPAMGMDNGFWTVVIAYERDDYGYFLPSSIGVFKR